MALVAAQLIGLILACLGSHCVQLAGDLPEDLRHCLAYVAFWIINVKAFARTLKPELDYDFFQLP